MIQGLGGNRQDSTAKDTPNLGFLARLYIGEVLLVGAIVLTLAFRDAPLPAGRWPDFFVIAAAMAAAQFLPAAGAGQYTSRPIVAFLVAGVAILPSPLLEMLVLVAVLVDALRRGRALHVRLFDGAAFLIAARAAALVHVTLSAYLPLAAEVATPVALLAGALVFLAVARLLLRSLTALTACGDRLLPLPLPLIDPSLLADLGLSCVGVVFAVVWQSNPWLAPVAFLPIVPISRGLKVAELETEASTDSKTLLLNLRAFEARAMKEFERASRERHSVAFIVADLDFLRNVNNTYGHLAGDMVLQRVGAIIRACLPENAFAARFGGEEFCVLVPDADAAEGLDVAEQIRRRVAEEQVTLPTTGQVISVTISMGVATFPYNGQDLRAVLDDADAAVYRAKMSGRNRSCLAMLGSAALASQRPGGGKQQRVWRASTRARARGGAALGAREPRQSAQAVDFYAGFVALVGPLAAIAVLLWRAASAPWDGLLIFVAAAVLADALSVDICAEKRVSPAFIVLLAGAMLFGVPAAVLIATAVAAFRVAGHGLNRRGFAVEFGALILSGTVVALAFSTFRQPLTFANLVHAALPALAAGMAGYFVYTVVQTLAIALEGRRNPLAVWNEFFRWLAGHYLLMAVLAALLAAAYAAYHAYALAAFAVPVFSMRYAFKQYMDRSSQSEAALAKANQHLRSTYENTLLALVAALDARDHETEGHSERVANYAVRIGEALGLAGDELAHLRLGALLHDIGKIGLPDSILRKNGPLNRAEWKQMNDHPRTGFSILQGIEFLGGPSQVVVCHHEHFDGSGYPLGLKGDEIPLPARIFAVADAYDAITSDRSYRSAQDTAVAIEEIERCSGTQFDPEVVAAFKRAFAGESEELQAAAPAEPVYGWSTAVLPAAGANVAYGTAGLRNINR